MRIRRALPSEARRQADWIAAIDPWRGMGYRPAALGRWLVRSARRELVFVAATGTELQGILVLQPEVLLGRFIALLAVVPAGAGRGVGRALVADAARRTSRAGARWLYSSSDAGNRAAAAFYRRLGFTRVGRLPDMVRPDRIEILWRRPA
jgi:ribosomal protein S18 acetylase RimI-like enzyme